MINTEIRLIIFFAPKDGEALSSHKKQDWELTVAQTESEVTQSCLTLCDLMDTTLHQAPLSMGFSNKSTGVGCHFLLQGIFPTQGLNPGLLHCRQTLYSLSYQGNPCRLYGRADGVLLQEDLCQHTTPPKTTAAMPLTPATANSIESYHKTLANFPVGYNTSL